MAEETTFFQSGDIAVTNARFVVGAQTFAMRGITSVQGVKRSAGYAAPIIMAAFGLALVVGFFVGVAGLGVFGLLILAADIWLFTRRRPIFAVVLRTAGGELTAYESKNRDQIASIIDALNQAIISHG